LAAVKAQEQDEKVERRGRKRMPPGARREQVLVAAEKVFAEKGYRAAQVTDIVERAGIGRGTFYLYFESKRDVFIDLVERYFSGFEAILKENRERLSGAGEGEKILLVWRENIIRIMAFHRDNPDLTSVVYREALGIDEDFSERVEELSRTADAQVHRELEILKQKGVLRPCDTELVASIVLGSSIYVIMQHLVGKKDADLGRLADEMLEYHVRALVPMEITFKMPGE